MVEGTVWKFGDDINTDLIAPTPYIYMPAKDQARHVFEVNRPGWVDQVKAGDVIVAGRNFGMGSSRPAPMVLREFTLGCVLAEFDQRSFLSKLREFRAPCAGMPWRLTPVRGGTAGANLLRRLHS